MQNSKTKMVGALAGSALLAGAGLAVAAPFISAGNDAPVAYAAQTESAADDVVNVKEVQGSFGYSQDAVSSNETIATMFTKAASSLCACMPQYANVMSADWLINVMGENSFDATIQELIDSNEDGTFIMGCACASNPAGGGAMVNAEVSGVSLATIAKLAGSL